MNTKIEGRCWVCQDNITVYQILPEKYWIMNRADASEEMAQWIFDDLESRTEHKPDGFRKLGYDIIIAGKNFGCGTKSVEHPMKALKAGGVKLVIAESLSRYSYRNAMNLALPVLICPGIGHFVKTDDPVTADIVNGEVINGRTGEKIPAEPLSDFALMMLTSGGLAKYAADWERNRCI